MIRYNLLAILVGALMCATTLFLFGGISVLSGQVGKGEFRASLGGEGAAAYLVLKWLAPAIFACACGLYLQAGRPRGARWSLLLLGFLTFVIGFSWGFKTSGLLVLLPGFTILLWQARFRSLVLPAVAAFGVVYLGFGLYDTLEGTVYDSATQFILARLTVFEGDMSWYVWGQWRDGVEFPGYWVTPLVAIGDQLFSLLTGITRNDPESWVLAHYGTLLTSLAGVPPGQIIEGGHNVTGTPFSEGIIALGAAGIPVFGLAAGIVTGLVFNRVNRALAGGRPVSAALWGTYSVFCLLAWLHGGEIVQLFHISVIVGFLAARVLLSLMFAVLPLSSSRLVVSEVPT